MERVRRLLGLCVVIFMLAGCGPQEKIIRSASGEVNFSITHEPPSGGKPITYNITAFLTDGTQLAQTVLISSPKLGLQNSFTTMDSNLQVFIMLRDSSKRTAWLVYDRRKQVFLNPVNFQEMNALAQQNGVTWRDMSVLESL